MNFKNSLQVTISHGPFYIAVVKHQPFGATQERVYGVLEGHKCTAICIYIKHYILLLQFIFLAKIIKPKRISCQLLPTRRADNTTIALMMSLKFM